MGIARLHAPREALYIDVKYNSLTHSLRADSKIVKTRPSGRALLVVLGMQQLTIACLDVAVCYCNKFGAIPNYSTSLLEIAVARASSF